MHHKMLVTTITTIVSIALVNVSYATPIIAPLLTTNGFYLAADIGAADFMTKESHSVAPESHQLGSIGAAGGVFVGYDEGINPWSRFAVEGFVEVTDPSTSISHGENTYHIAQNYNLGIRLLPEYVFTPFIVGHFIIGYVNGRFHINDNGVYGFINSTYYQGGLQTGLGLTTALQNNLFIRLDALYDSYASDTHTGIGLTTPLQFYTNRFSQLAGELAIIYKLC